MRTIDKIITKVNCKYGAPMGRRNSYPFIYHIEDGFLYAGNIETETTVKKKIYDCCVPLDCGAYDKGGVYWGFPANLRVKYTKDLSFVEFYRTY